MLVLITIGVLAGLIAGVSPCVLPILPVILVASGTAAGGDGGPVRRPMIVVLGLVLSFSIFTLLGSTLLTALHLPQDFLRWAGLAVLGLIGLSLVFPPLEELLQRPFRRVPKVFGRGRSGDGESRLSGNGFVFGLCVGTLYVPCAGPVLAAISIAGSSRHVSGGIAVLTVAFSVGVGIPLFVFALAGAGISRRLSAYRNRSRQFRIAGGAVMLLLAITLTFDLTDALQRAVPGYTQALQNKVEDNAAARHALAGLNEIEASTTSTPALPAMPTTIAPPAIPTTPRSAQSAAVATGPVVTCVSHATTLANCGPAEPIVGIQSWLNTPQDRPLTLTQLRGKVVLVNFWTFSCIDCQRTLPYLKAWYGTYHASGLEIIAVHTPEFSFEHDLGNVRDAVRSDGITYPVALDNSSATWRSYNNSYWPAEYLVDAQGVIRHVVDGEGGYADSEALIRQLLRAANPRVNLPAPTDSTVPIG